MQVKKNPVPLPAFVTLLFVVVAAAGCAAPVKRERSMLVIPTISEKPITENRHSLIIYPPGFEDSAKAFAYLHR